MSADWSKIMHQEAALAATFRAIIANQFQRTRDGDRLWYQNIFSGSQLAAIQNTKLSDIIQANTGTRNLQSNVFVFRSVISGTVSVAVQPGGSIVVGEHRWAAAVAASAVAATAAADRIAKAKPA